MRSCETNQDHERTCHAYFNPQPTMHCSQLCLCMHICVCISACCVYTNTCLIVHTIKVLPLWDVFHMYVQYMYVHWLQREIITVCMDMGLCDSVQFSRYVRVSTCMCVNTCVYVNLCLLVCVGLCVSAHACMSVRMCNPPSRDNHHGSCPQ